MTRYTIAIQEQPGQPRKILDLDETTEAEARRAAREQAGQGYIGGSVALYAGDARTEDLDAVAVYERQAQQVIER